MARSSRSGTRIVAREAVIAREAFYWPDQQINLFLLTMLGAGGALTGIFGSFIQVQQQLNGLGIPWLFPYAVTVGSLTILFVLIMFGLIAQRRLIPAFVILGCFTLLVLYLAGLIETAIQLFGAAQVNANCINYIYNQPFKTLSIETLAWLSQNAICQSWQAAFAMWVIGSIFLAYFIFVASAVSRGAYTE